MTDLSRQAYAIVVSRLGLFAVLALAMVAGMVALGAALEFMQASAEPSRGGVRQSVRGCPGGSNVTLGRNYYLC